MPDYEHSHWAVTEQRVADFIIKFGKISAEAMAEIAIQLMWVNAHLQELHTVVHRIADSR